MYIVMYILQICIEKNYRGSENYIMTFNENEKKIRFVPSMDI